MLSVWVRYMTFWLLLSPSPSFTPSLHSPSPLHLVSPTQKVDVPDGLPGHCVLGCGRYSRRTYLGLLPSVAQSVCIAIEAPLIR